jgi:HAD superfamily hydrolase (TIGR01549 family)
MSARTVPARGNSLTEPDAMLGVLERDRCLAIDAWQGGPARSSSRSNVPTSPGDRPGPATTPEDDTSMTADTSSTSTDTDTDTDGTASRTTAILFDIDGTLVDSNFLHIEAWARAFWQCDREVAAWRIQRAIGADSSELIGMLTEDDIDEATRSQLKTLHTKNYAELGARLNALPGARELVREIAGRGARVILATSAPQEELDLLLEVLDLGEAVHAVTSGEDVDTAKPDPGLIAIALERAGVGPDDAIMVGDASWDVIAAERAGLATVAVLSGGTGEHELREAGAVAVYEDAAAVLADLDDGPLAALLR